MHFLHAIFASRLRIPPRALAIGSTDEQFLPRRKAKTINRLERDVMRGKDFRRVHVPKAEIVKIRTKSQHFTRRWKGKLMNGIATFRNVKCRNPFSAQRIPLTELRRI